MGVQKSKKGMRFTKYSCKVQKKNFVKIFSNKKKLHNIFYKDLLKSKRIFYILNREDNTINLY